MIPNDIITEISLYYDIHDAYKFFNIIGYKGRERFKWSSLNYIYTYRYLKKFSKKLVEYVHEEYKNNYGKIITYSSKFLIRKSIKTFHKIFSKKDYPASFVYTRQLHHYYNKKEEINKIVNAVSLDKIIRDIYIGQVPIRLLIAEYFYRFQEL